MKCVVLDAMGVVFSAADDVVELLIPFIRESGGVEDDGLIQSTYVEASLGSITADEFWVTVGLRASVEDDYLMRHSLMPGAIEFLRTADERGVPIWILSNDVERWSRKLRALLGIARYASGAVISSDARARKPSAAIYRCLLDRCGHRPADILFVDDRAKNVEAARDMGMSALPFEADTGFSPLLRSFSRPELTPP
jgi:HAD superfamily hydrolase (TIGR01509 family)